MPQIFIKRRASLLTLFWAVATITAVTALWLPREKPLRLPELEFSLLDGRRLPLAALRGRPVLVSFWATTCAPCVEELPDFIRLYRELEPKGFELIAVAMPYDPPLQVRNFSVDRAVPYPIALDVEGHVTRAFDGVRFIPTAYLIDPTGQVVYRQTGKLDVARVRRMIMASLNLPPS